MTVAAPIRRTRVSDAFLATNRRRRILDGLAKAIAETSYWDAHIADIVRLGGCARKTFYDAFGSKADAGRALLSDVCPVIDRSPEDGAAVTLALEIVALWRAGKEDAALEEARAAQALLSSLAGRELSLPEVDESLQGTLPPGRHGLPREFVRANQRHRLLCGLASAVAEHGFRSTTIAHVTSNAAVSRRTFYEHFTSADDAALGLLVSDDAINPASALGAVAVEAVAAKLTGKDRSSADEAEVLLRILVARFEDGEQVPA